MTNLISLSTKHNDRFKKNYNNNSFWNKVVKNALKAGKKVIYIALKAYYALNDEDTPAWAKGVIMGALGYFICPIDLIPDFTPAIGYVDDMGVLLSAIASVALHVKESHKIKAKEQLKTWFD
jgi:uncharacterized membrane protein YkvA (DUF1232 family)